MYGICVTIFILGIGSMYISKSYKTTKNTLDQEHMYKAGATIVSTITSTSIIIT